MRPRTLAALAVADFRDRVRRPAYVVTVLAAVALGYLAAPPGAGNYAMFKLGEFRGVYDSHYLGTLMALVGALWLAMGGFYVVKNAIAKDTATGVGQILAASPLRNAAYLLGKFLSNLLILSTMAGFLAVTALGMLLLRGESSTVDPVALWLPFPLLCLPALAVSAAAAVLFESVRPLRGGAGNVLWFFAFLAVGLWFAPGLSAVAASMREDLLVQHPGLTSTEISLGLTVEEAGLQTFRWTGLEVTGGLVVGQLGLLLAAVLIATLPALWFGRFDPGRRRRPAPAATAGPPSGPDPVAGGFAAVTRPQTAVRRGKPFRRLVAGELRVLLKGQSRWWWTVLVGLTGVALFVPPGGLNVMLLLAWLWPVLLWSRLGAHAFTHDVQVLVDAGAGPRRVLAEWLAGVAIAGLAGAGPLVRMLAGDGAGVAAWVGGAAFIPALALLLGTLSRSPRLFQVVYLGLWYAVLNRTAAVDFAGAVRDGGQLAGPVTGLVLGVATGLLAGALATKQVRHARR
jgi:hypothetical protein